MNIKVISLAPGSDDDEDERKIPLTPKFKEDVEQGIAPLFRSPVIKAESLHMNTTTIGAKNNAFEVAVSSERVKGGKNYPAHQVFDKMSEPTSPSVRAAEGLFEACEKDPVVPVDFCESSGCEAGKVKVGYDMESKNELREIQSGPSQEQPIYELNKNISKEASVHVQSRSEDHFGGSGAGQGAGRLSWAEIAGKRSVRS
ncbi:hypothetical protein U1Q18_032901 [Sarracenia purpurea var. burkii]